MTASSRQTERTPERAEAGSLVGPTTREKGGLIGLFVRHRTAANLLMILMLIAGALGLNRMTTQFFPDFGVDTIAVTVAWPASSAADAEANIVRAVDREVRFIDDVRSVKATAYEGGASVFIEFEPGSNMQRALSNVEMALGRITTFPEDSETPQVKRIVRYDGLSRILISGPYSETALKNYATQIRDGLLDRGVDKVNLSGFRDAEILVEIQPETLRRLQIGLDDVARQIRAATENIPSGALAGQVQRQIRSSGRIVSLQELGEIDVQSITGGEQLLLRDIANVREGFDDDSATYWRNGDRAIVLQAMRTPDADALAIADTVADYLEEVRTALPPNLNIETFDIQAELIRSRLDLLIENGAMGLAIVLTVLFLFLNARVAFWVAAGIPISLAAAMLVMWLTGQSINMVSMFAIIMVLGIVVDDAIVVGEHSEALHRRGFNAQLAAETAARRMAAPVFCASITTIAAFLPLLLITDAIGAVIRTVPIVVLAVIVASLIECFLVLPGHMRLALTGQERTQSRAGLLSPLFGIGLLWLWPAVPVLVSMRALIRILLAVKIGFERRFERFRNEIFLPVLRLTIRWRYTTMALAVTALIGASALVAGGRVDFVFFPAPEADTIYANLWFTAGTPESRTQQMLLELERSLESVDRRLSRSENGGDLVRFHYGVVGSGIGARPWEVPVRGSHLAGMFVQLQSAELRTIDSARFIAAWEAEIRRMSGLRQLTIKAAFGGPPGRDVDIRFSGGTAAQLKAAAEDAKSLLQTLPGVSALQDDLPHGKPETSLELTPMGQALDITAQSVGRQVRNAFEGVIAMRFARGDEEVAVRVRFPEERLTSETLHNLYLQASSRSFIPLSSVAEFREELGFAMFKSEYGEREVAVTADLDHSVITTQKVIQELEREGLADIAQRHGVAYRFDGRNREQRRTFRDMGIGAVVGLMLIFITLAWTLSSYTRPIVIMSIVPMGLVGAVVGHYAMGYDLTVLSLIAIVGLSGIVVNGSIILVSVIEERIRGGEPLHEAIALGTCDRLRAIVLTAITTIGALAPLMFETDLQARFLIPMGITIVFGLMVGTLLVLFVVPSLLAIQADLRGIFRDRNSHSEWERQNPDPV